MRLKSQGRCGRRGGDEDFYRNNPYIGFCRFSGGSVSPLNNRRILNGREGEAKKMNDTDIKTKLRELHSEARELERKATTQVAGLKAMITSNYNGQPYGRSKPSMKGKIVTVTDCYLDHYDEPYVFVKGLRVALSINEIRFMS